MKNPLILFFLFATTVGVSHSQAQESVNSSGGDAESSQGSVSYSIGQVVYTTNMGSKGSQAQGVQHAFEIFTVGVKETALNISFTAFPNPTTQNLTLQISDYTPYTMAYQLLNMQGKQLSNGEIGGQQTQIEMNGFPTGTYFLNVVNPENKTVQSFKIIKI